MPYFVIVDLNSIGPQDSEGNASAEVLALRDKNGEVLPVFTSLNRFWAFVDKWYAGDDSVHPTTFPMDPFELAEMVGPMGESGLFDTLLFNPVAVSARKWKYKTKPIPLTHYCRFISEIRPGIEKVVQDGEVKFGDLSAPETHLKVLRWSMPRLEELARNAGARVEEWEVRDDS